MLDANGERAAVMETLATNSTTAVGTNPYGTSYAAAHSEIRRPVCITPCVADFDAGMHELSFESREDVARKSTAEVQIDERTKAIRQAMGRTEQASPVQTAAMVVGTVGTIFLLAGGMVLALSGTGGSPEVNQRLQSAGTKMAIGGGATLALSIPFLILTRPVRQPGSTTTVSE